MSGTIAVAEPSIFPPRGDDCDRGQAAAGGAWGPFATLALGVGIFLAYQFATVAVVTASAFNQLASNRSVATTTVLESVARDGFYGSLAVGIAAMFCTGLILALTRMRTPTHRDYLGLAMSPLRATALWVLAMIFLQVFWLLAPRLGIGQAVSVYVVDLVRAGRGVPLMWIAYVVFIPAFEELFARGFLYAGWERSRLGPWGAVIATTLFWTGTHMQYSAIELAQVASAGFLFGAARLQTGSIFPSLVMHAGTNYLALEQASRYMGNLGSGA